MIGLRLPFPGQGLTQYMGVQATGVAMLTGKPVVGTADGIHILDSQTGDDGSEISAWFESAMTDFGTQGLKRMRTVYVRGKVENLEIRLKSGGQETLRESGPISGELSQDGFYISGERAHAGRYWSVRIANVDGADFSIDAVDAAIIIRPSKAGERGR